MESEEIERAVLSSIKSPVDLQTLRQTYSLSAQSFVFRLEEASFIWDYVTQYGDAPTAELLKTRFPDFEHSPLDNFDYICKQFRNEYVRRMVLVGVHGHGAALLSDADQAITSLVNQLLSIQLKDSGRSHVVDSFSVDDKLQRYQNRIKGADSRRLSWGIEPLDNFPLRLTKGQFVGIIADTKSGKSWFALKIGLANYLKGCKVGIVSPELTVPEIEDRIDTVLAKMFGFPILHDSLASGLPGIEVNYQKYLEASSALNRQDLIIYPFQPKDKITPLTTIAGILSSDAPDILIIDGVYMVDDDYGEKQSWDQMKKKCQDLKTLATATNTALVVTNQTGRDRDANSDQAAPAMARLVAGGYDFNRFVDILISLGGHPGVADTRQVAVPLVRNQRAFSKNFEVTFDPDTGDIGRAVGEEPAMDFRAMAL